MGFVAFGGGATWGATVTKWTLPVQSTAPAADVTAAAAEAR